MITRTFHNESIGRYSQARSILLILPIFLFLAFFYLCPLIKLFPTSLFTADKFTWEHYEHFFREPLYLNVLLRTIRISFIVTSICFVLAYPVAYFLSSIKSSVSTVLLAVFVLLPFWTSILVRSYSWIVLCQSNGTINQLLLFLGLIDQPLPLLHNEFAVTVGMIHILLPFMILPIYSVLKSVDPNLNRAARNLGASPFWVFILIIFPLSLPGVGAGVLFVFILSLGFYVTPALLGGPSTLMISTLIDQQINRSLNWEFAAAIAVLLLITTIIMIVIFNKLVGLDKIYSEKV